MKTAGSNHGWGEKHSYSQASSPNVGDIIHHRRWIPAALLKRVKWHRGVDYHAWQWSHAMYGSRLWYVPCMVAIHGMHHA